MAFQELTEHLEESAKKSQDYVKNTAEYYKLRAFKSSMKVATSATHGLIIGSVFLLFLAFFSIGIALAIGELLDNMLWGFLAVSCFYLLLVILILIFGKNIITKTMLSKFSEMMFEDNDIPEQQFDKDQVSHENILPKDNKEYE